MNSTANDTVNKITDRINYIQRHKNNRRIKSWAILSFRSYSFSYISNTVLSAEREISPLCPCPIFTSIHLLILTYASPTPSEGATRTSYQNKAQTPESPINFALGITKQRPAKSSSPALLPHGGNAAHTCPPPCRAPEAPEENNHLLPQGYRPILWAAA